MLRKTSNYPSLLKSTKSGFLINLMKKSEEIGRSSIFPLIQNITTGLMLNLKNLILIGLRNMKILVSPYIMKMEVVTRLDIYHLQELATKTLIRK